MEALTVIALATMVLAFGLISRRLQHGVVTAPMVFVVFGLLIGQQPLGLMHAEEAEGAIHLFAEITLILVLFGDATRIDLRALRREYDLPVRMLAIGMPLTIALGTGLALWLVPEFPVFEASLLAAILTPTDAALGQSVVSEPSVPARVRQTLNVESGLNDGIALPVILVLAAFAEPMGEHDLQPFALLTAKQLVLGPVVGVAVAWLGGQAIELASDRGWMNRAFQQLSGLSLAFLAFAASEWVGGNGFIAAFVGGLTMGNTARDPCGCIYEFLETEGQALILVTFLLFGAVMIGPAVEHWTPEVWLYVALSLTVARMLPVALSLIGLRLQPATFAFLGWFGPRGLASILFGLLIVERTGIALRHEIIAIVVATVLTSVFAHGISAYPAARVYGRHIARRKADPASPEHRGVAVEMPTRAGPLEPDGRAD